MTPNMRGILAMITSSAGFVVNDALVKLATAELPTGQIIVIRGAMATIILAIATTVAGAWRPPRVLLMPAMVIRLVGSAFATLFIVQALRHLPLATTSAILQVTPLAVVAGAAMLLREPVGWPRWIVSLLGLVGVMLIIRPGSASFIPEVWIACVALIFTATRDLTTRFIDHSIPSVFVAMASSAVITIAGLGWLPFETWAMPSLHTFLLLLGASASLYFAYTFGVVGMRVGEIAVVAPFRYALILFALVLGYAIWGHVPDLWSWYGIFIVCAAGLLLLHLEGLAEARRRLAREAAAEIRSS